MVEAAETTIAIFKDIQDARVLVGKGLIAPQKVESVFSHFAATDPQFPDVRLTPYGLIGRRSEQPVIVPWINEYQKAVGDWNKGFDELVGGKTTFDELVDSRLAAFEGIRVNAETPRIREYYRQLGDARKVVKKDITDLRVVAEKGLIPAEKVDATEQELEDQLNIPGAAEIDFFTQREASKDSIGLGILTELYKESKKSREEETARSSQAGNLLNELASDSEFMQPLLRVLEVSTSADVGDSRSREYLISHYKKTLEAYPLLEWASQRYLGFGHVEELLRKPDDVRLDTSEHIRLRKGESVWNSERIKEIRERFKGKKVAVVDANGVLCDNRAQYMNPQAKKTLQALRDAGFELVLWTAAIAGIEDELAAAGLMEYFSLGIFQENYRRNRYKTSSVHPISEQVAAFGDAVDSTPWLSADIKEALKDPNHDSKTPSVLFESCVMFDDVADEMFESSLEGESNRYTYVKVKEYNSPSKSTASVRHQTVVKDDPEYFTPGILSRIGI